MLYYNYNELLKEVLNMANTRRRYTKEEKSEILAEVAGGKSVPEIAEEKGISQATIRQWTRRLRLEKQATAVTADGIKSALAQYDQRIEALQAQIEEVEKEKQAYKDNLKAILESIAE